MNIFNTYQKHQWATLIAIVFHLIGLIGILFINPALFSSLSTINLLLMFVLMIYTEENDKVRFITFLILCFIISLSAEMIGVNKGWLFGTYTYGNTLGPKMAGVPLMIGLNWCMIIYCCGTTMKLLLDKVIPSEESNSKIMRTLSTILDGAILAVIFDWLMEPVAMKLGYWNWDQNIIPMFNYVCWFTLSVLLLIIFNRLLSKTRNKFALHLLMIEATFFLILRICL